MNRKFWALVALVALVALAESAWAGGLNGPFTKLTYGPGTASVADNSFVGYTPPNGRVSDNGFEGAGVAGRNLELDLKQGGSSLNAGSWWVLDITEGGNNVALLSIEVTGNKLVATNVVGGHNGATTASWDGAGRLQLGFGPSGQISQSNDFFAAVQPDELVIGGRKGRGLEGAYDLFQVDPNGATRRDLTPAGFQEVDAGLYRRGNQWLATFDGDGAIFLDRDAHVGGIGVIK